MTNHNPFQAYQVQKRIFQYQGRKLVLVSRHSIDSNRTSNRLTVCNQWCIGKYWMVFDILQSCLFAIM